MPRLFSDMRRSFVYTSRSFCAPPVSPSAASSPRCRLPSTGSSPEARSPASPVLCGSPTPPCPSRGLRLSSSIATARVTTRFVAPPGARHRSGRPGPLSPGCPPRALPEAETRGSPRFLACPSALVPPSSTPVGPPPLAFSRMRLLPSIASTISAPTSLADFGASSLRPVRSLSTLRTRSRPRRTQDSLPACWLGFDRVEPSSTGHVRSISGHVFPPCSPGLPWRTSG
jgi:hypothetical protein